MRPLLLLAVFTPALLAAPPEVAVCRPVEREITETVGVSGRTEPSTVVHVRSWVSGQLDKVLFKEGTEVKKGDLLFQLDDRVQRAEVAKAEAEIARAEARLRLAQAQFERARDLAKANAVGKEELDKLAASLEEAKAVILAARASAELAKLNLECTRIIAPISGRIGRSAVDAGNMVRGNADKDEPLASIVVADPLHLHFNVGELYVLRLRKLIRDQKNPDARIMVALGVADDKDYPRQAPIDFVDSHIDPINGTARVRVVLPNPRGELIPGQSVRGRLPVSLPHKVILIPTSAVMTAKGGHVFVVDDKNRLVQRPVRCGLVIDGEVVIEDGLTANDWVMIEPRHHEPGAEVNPKREKPMAKDAKPGEPRAGPVMPRALEDFPTADPAIVVTANYPGANSHVVGEVVAGPIEAQLDGMDNVVHRVVACSDDGEMQLTLVLKKGTDVNKALIEAKRRVALAEPTLPEEVRRQGIQLKKPAVHLLAVALYSADNSYERTFLAKYADFSVRRELAGVSGVAAVRFYGDSAPTTQLRVRIDRERLAARSVTAAEVANAIREQNLPATATRGENRMIAVSGPNVDPEQLEKLVIKNTKEGVAIRLRDIARIESVSVWGTATSVDGKPCAMLLVSRSADADARDATAAVRARLTELAKHFPVKFSFKVIDGGPGN